MLTIHGVPVSVHTRKVIVTAIEKKLDYRLDPVIPFHPPAGWDKLSPTGKIPVITDGDFVLRDSAAICAYLERIEPAYPIYPAEARELGQVLWLEQYAGTLFREVVHGLFLNKIIRPKILKHEGDAGAVEAILKNALPPAFGYLDEAATGDFLAAGRFTVADIAIVSNLINFHYLGYRIDGSAYPRLSAYFGRQLQRPSLRTALAGERAAAESMGLDRSFLGDLAEAA